MSNVVISVENISKQYRLGKVGTGALAHDLNRFWYNLLGKEDPYLKIGEENDRTIKGQSEYVWALRDINFEILKGEILGIIGKNGAGKSTLLKILSRTTAPTSGTIKIKGRVASLLEVGTGFHPELSGRDNIFLNGAILGMTKREIKSKFDEIVDFAGVDRYIDTPVKRYSSGMYVRLAFAVAAHLEPEILIVDEVLAVGDVEFQKKCLGKMKDVSEHDGRTVLFVSHNLRAVSELCERVVVVANGSLQHLGPTDEMINLYLENEVKNNYTLSIKEHHSKQNNSEVIIDSVKVTDESGNDSNVLKIGEPLRIRINYKGSVEMDNCFVSIVAKDANRIGLIAWRSNEWETDIPFRIKHQGSVVLTTAPLNLVPGTYFLSVSINSQNKTLAYLEDILFFEVLPGNMSGLIAIPKRSIYLNKPNFKFI